MNAFKTYGSLLFTALLFAACGSETAQETAGDLSINEHFTAVSEEQQKLAGITFGAITEQDVEQKLSCSGVIDVPPANRVSMTTVYGGYITYTGVYPGDKVTKGQLLARLQDPLYIDLQRNYLEGLSKLAFLQSDFERKTELQKTESVSAKQYQQAKRDVETVSIEVAALAAQLKMAGFSTEKLKTSGVQAEVEIRSPINGYVTSVNVNQGLHMQQGEVLFELMDPTHMHIELNVYPNDLDKLQEGQPVYFRVAGSTNVRQGSIKLINKAVTANNRSILVHVHPREEDEDGLLPGTFVQAEIVFNAQKFAVLPISGVTRSENMYTAYKRVEGGVEAIFFSPEFATADFVDARALAPGEYVLAGADKLISLDEGGHGH
jgi:cobalt-zinc-cadmium efflux system membrane fusion protein